MFAVRSEEAEVVQQGAGVKLVETAFGSALYRADYREFGRLILQNEACGEGTVDFDCFDTVRAGHS